MSETSTGNANATIKHPLYGAMTANWKWMVGLGVLIMALGAIGLGIAYALTLVSVVWFGVLAVVAGVAQLIDAFKYSGWKATLSHILLGALYGAAGVVMIAMPVQSAWWLTLLVGITLVVTGALRLVMAVQMRAGPVTVGLGLSGLISIALGIAVYTMVDLPAPADLAAEGAGSAWFGEWGWVIGAFVAVEFALHGATLVLVGLAARAAGTMLGDESAQP